MEEYIISANKGGLGNRIKCLVSSMRIARRYSKSLMLFWPKNVDCNCGFSELFANKIDEIKGEEFNALIDRDKIEKYEVLDTWRFVTFPEDKLPHNFAKMFPSEPGNDIDFEYERIPLLARQNLLSFLNKLIPRDYIIEETDKFSRNFDAGTISVNVRSWEKEKWSNFFSKKNIFKTLDREKQTKFFIVCDSQSVLNEITKKYGGRIISYPRRTPPGDRNSPAGIQDSLIELFLLSKNKELKASLLSTYSEMAWWFSGCRANVEIFPPSLAGHMYLFSHRIKNKIRKLLKRYG